MRVEIWSDFVCPWCYIGKRRFETALARFDRAEEIEVIWKSFQLNPDQPKGKPEPVAEHLAAKYGVSVDEARAMNDRVKAIAAVEGLAYDFDRYTMVNTFDAHRLTHLANARGLGAELHERLLRAQLVEGKVLEDVDTLVRLAVEIGLPENDARRVLDSDAYTDQVIADIEELRGLGGNGVPFFVIDRRYGISGAQPADVFLNALETAHRQAAPLAAGR